MMSHKDPSDELCKNCGESFEPGFDVCWNCTADRDGFVRTELPVLQPGANELEEKPKKDPLYVTIIYWLGMGALSFIGFVDFSKERESKKRLSGDFSIPRWVNPILLGIAVIVVSSFFRDRSHMILGYVVGALFCCWGPIRYAVERGYFDQG